MLLPSSGPRFSSPLGLLNLFLEASLLHIASMAKLHWSRPFWPRKPHQEPPRGLCSGCWDRSHEEAWGPSKDPPQPSAHILAWDLLVRSSIVQPPTQEGLEGAGYTVAPLLVQPQVVSRTSHQPPP